MFIPEENKNPYNCIYVFNDENKQCDFELVNAIKTIRNTLVHDGGRIKEENRSKIKKLRDYKDDVIRIDIQTLAEIRTVLSSVARNIYELTTKTIAEDKEIAEYQKMLKDRESYISAIDQCKKEMAELEEQLYLLDGALFTVNMEIEEYERREIEEYLSKEEYCSEEMSIPPNLSDSFDIPPDDPEIFIYNDYPPDEQA